MPRRDSSRCFTNQGSDPKYGEGINVLVEQIDVHGRYEHYLGNSTVAQAIADGRVKAARLRSLARKRLDAGSQIVVKKGELMA